MLTLINYSAWYIQGSVSLQLHLVWQSLREQEALKYNILQHQLYVKFMIRTKRFFSLQEQEKLSSWSHHQFQRFETEAIHFTSCLKSLSMLRTKAHLPIARPESTTHGTWNSNSDIICNCSKLAWLLVSHNKQWFLLPLPACEPHGNMEARGHGPACAMYCMHTWQVLISGERPAQSALPMGLV